MNAIGSLLGIQHPLIQAPMAGGPTTAELVAAVSNAGALGSLGAGYMSADDILATCRDIRQRTSRPFAVNLFIPEKSPPDEQRTRAASEALAPLRQRLDVREPESLPKGPSQPFADQLEAVIEARVPVFSFTFGVPDNAAMERLKAAGIRTIGTATTAREGQLLEKAGVDAVVAQGFEAGGHRGTFAGDFGESMVGLMALVPRLADAVSIPVIASGGLMDGRGIAASLILGAAGAQLGTAFLFTREAEVPEVWRSALASADDDATAISRVFSGKPARGIRNRFMTEYATAPVADYPAQNGLTGLIRRRAKEKSLPEWMSLWAGQAASMGRVMGAAELVETLMRETDRSLDRRPAK